MADFSFNTVPGQTVARELLLAYLNTGTSNEPVWSVLGKRVEDSSMAFDWSTETKKDILGSTYSTGKKSIRTQTFEPCELDSADAAQQKLWELGIKEDNVSALMNLDVLVVHLYMTNDANGAFAERYPSSAILPTGLGGAGGGAVGMPIEVTFGGTRQTGAATVAEGGVVTFTPDSASAAASAEGGDA